MKLEELRSDDLGRICACFPREGQELSSMVSITYPEYCTKAFYLTCQSVEQLERSKNIISQGSTTIMAVGMWFIAIEAFINSLLRIACRVIKSDFSEQKTRDIGARLGALLEMLKIRKELLYRSGIFQKLEEFKTFRNEIFHDRTWEGELAFHKTHFCSVPHLANQVDVVQAAIISLEIFHAFRHVYQGLDLMPEIYVAKEDSFGFIKLNVLYEKVLRPFFAAALEKHTLTTELRLTPTLIELDVSAVSAVGDISIIVKAIQAEEFKLHVNETDTSIGSDLFKAAQELITIKPAEQFGLPGYIRR